MILKDTIAWFNKSGSISYLNNNDFALEHGHFWSDLVIFDKHYSEDKKYVCEIIINGKESLYPK